MATEDPKAEFRNQIALLQGDALKAVSKELLVIESRHAEEGKLLSGATIHAYGNAAASCVDKFTDELIEEITVFVDQLNIPMTDIIEDAKVSAIQLPLQILELKIVTKLEGAMKKPSVKLHMLKIMDDSKSRTQAKLRRLEIGIRNNKSSTGGTTNVNNVNATNVGVVQQGNQNSAEVHQNQVDSGAVIAALNLMETVLKDANAQQSILLDIQNDIETIRTQLAKSKPSRGVIHEASKSIRSISEGAAGGILASQLGPALAMLATAIS